MTFTAENVVLTAEDRCDRCGAAAKVVAFLPSGGELMFCGHHWRLHDERLGEIGAEIWHDRPSAITQRRQP